MDRRGMDRQGLVRTGPRRCVVRTRVCAPRFVLAGFGSDDRGLRETGLNGPVDTSSVVAQVLPRLSGSGTARVDRTQVCEVTERLADPLSRRSSYGPSNHRYAGVWMVAAALRTNEDSSGARNPAQGCQDRGHSIAIPM